MLRLLLLSFCSSAAVLLSAAELRIALFTPAQGDAAAFRKLVNSSVIGAPWPVSSSGSRRRFPKRNRSRRRRSRC